RKPRYDDHTQDAVRAQIAVRELNRPQLFEEKIAISASVLLGHLERHRHTALLAVWDGIKAQRRGDHRRALQIYGDIARLGGRMRESSPHLMGSLLGKGIQLIAWERGTSLTPHERRQVIGGVDSTQSTSTKLYVTNFAQYAQAHRRPDLADEARREVAVGEQWQQAIRDYWKTIFFAGLSRRTMKATFSLWWMSVGLLSQLQVTFLVWLILSALLWHQTKDQRHRNDESRDTAVRDTAMGDRAVRGLDVASSVLWIVSIITVLGIVALRLGAGWGEIMGFFEDSAGGDPASNRPLIVTLGLLIALAPVLLGGLYSAAASCWRHRRELGARLRAWLTFKPSSFNLFRKAATGATGNDASSVSWLRRDLTPFLKPFLALAICGGIIFAAWLSWVSVVDSIANGSPPDYTLPLTLSVLCLVAVLQWRRMAAPLAHPGLLYGVHWYRSTLGAFLVLTSVAYLAVSLASLPLRREADARMGAYLRSGEMALIRQHSGQR
ncbi:MAG: hypothetical protein M3347_13640, partial [Armatimonadota bacterium]|nr:hypothetical protein [Armatimonadota bacterium]